MIKRTDPLVPVILLALGIVVSVFVVVAMLILSVKWDQPSSCPPGHSMRAGVCR